jgi:hypothetical protein
VGSEQNESETGEQSRLGPVPEVDPLQRIHYRQRALSLLISSDFPGQRAHEVIRTLLRSRAVIEGRSELRGRSDHRARPATVVFTKMACHASCRSCGAVGSGCSTAEEAQRMLLTLGKSGGNRYL